MNPSYIVLLVCISWANANPLKVIIVGDWGVDNDNQYTVAQTMGEWAAEHGADFILSTGDNFYPDGVESPEDPRLETTWKNVYTHPGIAELPWYISVGNHDHHIENGEWYQVGYSTREPRWVFPDLTYSFTALADGTMVRFVALDTQSLRNDKNDKDFMLKYLDDELSRNDPTWKIAFGHHPAYSCGGHSGASAIREEVEPIMLAHDADFLIAGHDHSMQHWQTTSGTDMDHITTGGGGRGLHRFNEDRWESEEARGKTLRNFTYSHGFIYLEIEATSAKFSFVSEEAEVLYSYTRTK